MFIIIHLNLINATWKKKKKKKRHLPNEIELLNDKEAMLMHGDENYCTSAYYIA